MPALSSPFSLTHSNPSTISQCGPSPNTCEYAVMARQSQPWEQFCVYYITMYLCLSDIYCSIVQRVYVGPGIENKHEYIRKMVHQKLASTLKYLHILVSTHTSQICDQHPQVLVKRLGIFTGWATHIGHGYRLPRARVRVGNFPPAKNPYPWGGLPGLTWVLFLCTVYSFLGPSSASTPLGMHAVP